MPEHALWILTAGMAGGLVFGLTGFAFGVVGSILLHHALPPTQVLLVIVAGGLVLNLLSLPRFARLMQWRLAAPFIAGATFGIPLGVAVLEMLPPAAVRTAAGVMILVHCVVGLWWRNRGPVPLAGQAARAADLGIGVVGGMAGGIAGLGPLVPAVWYGLRGWSRDEQRGLVQAFGLYVQSALLLWLLARGHVHGDGWPALAVALPGMLLGAWVGSRLYGKVSTSAFQRIVLAVCAAGAGWLLLRQFLGAPS